MTDYYSLDDVSPRLVALTRDLILFPSTVERPDDRDRCSQFIRNHLESLEGIEVREYTSGGFSSLVALPRGVTEPEIMFCAHYDVVQHPDVHSYQPSVEDGRICGPGSGDMKGPLAISLELFQSMHRRYPGVSLGIALTSDEEIGGEHGMRYLFDEMGLRCGLAIIPDGGSMNEITVEEKGILHIALSVKGEGESSHASRPWLGFNALDILTEGLHELRKFFRSFERPTGRWYPTGTLTILRTPNTTVNRIPHEAEAFIDVRFPAPHTAQNLIEQIREVVDCGIEVRREISAEPTYLSPDPRFRQIMEEVIGQPVSLIRESGGSDARFVCPYGIPVIMSRPTMGNIHAEDEWIDIESMVTFYGICERYLIETLVPSR